MIAMVLGNPLAEWETDRKVMSGRTFLLPGFLSFYEGTCWPKCQRIELHCAFIGEIS
jgi:hypothetical protein